MELSFILSMLYNLKITNLWLPQIDYIINFIYLLIVGLYIIKLNNLNFSVWYFNKNFKNSYTDFFQNNKNTFYNYFSSLICLIMIFMVAQRLFLFTDCTSSNNLITINNTSQLSLISINLLTFVIFLAFNKYSSDLNIHIEANLLILMSLIGLDFLVIANDLLIFYVALELQNLCIIALCGLQLSSLVSIESSVKMYLLSSYSSALIILSMSLLFFSTGITSWNGFYDYLSLSNSGITNQLNIYFWLFNIAILWKLGAAPIHLWLVDILNSARLLISTFISIVPKIALFAMLSNKLLFFINIKEFNLFYFIIVSCFIIGPISAIKQTELRLMIAFSSVGQLGFILSGLYITNIYLVFLNIIFYMVTLLYTWFTITLNKNFIFINNIKNISGNIGLLILWLTFSINLAGLPPLPTFNGKLLVMYAIINYNQYGLVLISLVSTIISSYYSIRLMQLFIQPNFYTFVNYGYRQNNSLVALNTILGCFLFSLFWYYQPINNLLLINYI